MTLTMLRNAVTAPANRFDGADYPGFGQAERETARERCKVWSIARAQYGALHSTPSKNSTQPVSSEYSAPTTSKPSS